MLNVIHVKQWIFTIVFSKKRKSINGNRKSWKDNWKYDEEVDA